MTLKPHESAWVALRLRPLRPGLLTLTGVAWLLNGIAPGRKPFTLRPSPTHRRTASRWAMGTLPKQALVSPVVCLICISSWSADRESRLPGIHWAHWAEEGWVLACAGHPADWRDRASAFPSQSCRRCPSWR